MKDLSDKDAEAIIGGAGKLSCGYAIAVTASFGGLFGGAGAIIGAISAATGPACLGWW